MSNTTLNAVASVSTPAVVVANPSINVKKIGKKAQVVVSNTTSATKSLPIEQLKSMEIARISWETTELAQSNNRLYRSLLLSVATLLHLVHTI